MVLEVVFPSITILTAPPPLPILQHTPPPTRTLPYFIFKSFACSCPGSQDSSVSSTAFAVRSRFCFVISRRQSFDGSDEAMNRLQPVPRWPHLTVADGCGHLTRFTSLNSFITPTPSSSLQGSALGVQEMGNKLSWSCLVSAWRSKRHSLKNIVISWRFQAVQFAGCLLVWTILDERLKLDLVIVRVLYLAFSSSPWHLLEFVEIFSLNTFPSWFLGY